MLRAPLRTLILTLTALTGAVTTTAARAEGTTVAGPSEARTITFPYEDEKRLLPGESQGGLAYVTAGVTDEPVPLVVFFHGLNDHGSVHFFYGLMNLDPRPQIDDLVARGQIAPFVFAAPSQTLHASDKSTMWDEFDLDDFVDSVEDALPDVSIDRDQLIVMGHSGGGCNPKGGLFAALASPLDLAGVVAIDTCLDADVGEILGRPNPGAPVWVYYQPFTWSREVTAFRTSFEAELASLPGRVGYFVVDDKGNMDPHNFLVERALREALPALLPGKWADPYQ